MARHNHICGLYIVPGPGTPRQYLPQLSLSANTKIVSSTSRTTLTQTFVNPKSEAIPELRYTFPLYEGASVVDFVCTINDDRVIHGVVKERAEAKKTYQAAVDRGETAGLLEQLPAASDVFVTTVGNVPANATLKVEVTYLGELKHDAEVDGIRFTIPTHIAPRYGNYPGQLLQSSAVDSKGGISIVVDVEMPDGSNVKNVQSPSHPISVTLGNTASGAASGADMSLQKASATLALSTAELGDDFILQIVATNASNPVAVLETHPTLPNHRALMATLVPKFNLPSIKPEIVFLCDRSGSMGGTNKIPNLKAALHLFLKSLPVGVKFNICSFGSHHEFLFKNGSRTYDQVSLEEAARYVDTFMANFGGTDIYKPVVDAFDKRYKDMELEVFLLTDGEIWDQGQLFKVVEDRVAESKGRIRVFSLGIGSDVSHALIEGVAAAGNGFSQSVGDNENMNSKVVRMLKASLTPHIMDYTMEVKYGKDAAVSSDDEEFEIVEKVMDALAIDVQEPEQPSKKPISLFDESANPDVEMTDPSFDASAGGKYSHVPAVPEPKLLQAPFNIPPLYAFNRTSVYLFLSPETAQKQPKSVVLRGTSQYGPVELEIPVTVLADKTETIHQLAARKAVKELEQGRGWIYHAKDAKDTAGALLKDKYPGRFDDMVEREAVRLGVKYQVGGRWCSFVAVEANNKARETAEEPTSLSDDPDGGHEVMMLHQLRSAAAPRMMAMSMLNQSAQPDRRASRRYCSYIPERPPLASKAARKSAPSPSPSSSIIRKQLAPPPASAHPPAPEPARMLDAGSSSPEPQPRPRQAAQFFKSVDDEEDDEDLCEELQEQMEDAFDDNSDSSDGDEASTSVGATRFLLAADSETDDDLDNEDADSFMVPAARSLARAAPGPAPAKKKQKVTGEMQAKEEGNESENLSSLSPEQKLALLVSLQGFTGAWKWEDKLLALVGLPTDKGGIVAPKELGGESEVLATGVVLVYLEDVLAGKRDEWEMLAEKARGWLEGEVKVNGGRVGEEKGVEGYLENVKVFLKGQGVAV